MKTISKFIALAAFAVSATAVQAQLYGEVGYSALKFNNASSVPTYNASPRALGATIGYDVHKNVAVEAMGVFGVKGSSINGTSDMYSLNSSYGVFVKPKVILGEDFEIFGRLGYMNSKMSASGPGTPSSLTSSSLAYGLGANYYLTKTTYLTASYINLYNKNNMKVDGVTFGLGMKF